jgi:hypothetical protein
MNNENNDDIISNNVWELLRPVFFAASVGMYAQFFTLFVHIAMQKTNSGDSSGPGESHGQNVQLDQNGCQGEEITRSERGNDQNSCETDEQTGLLSQPHQQETPPKWKAVIEFILDTLGYLYIIVTATISILSLNKGASLLKVVVWTQLVTHLLICCCCLATFLVLKCTCCVCRTTSCACNCCSLSLIKDRICRFPWWISADPERLVFILFFLMGGVGYNIYSWIVYREKGDCLGDSTEKKLGQAEAGFGLSSAILVFSVIFYLKLNTEEKRDNPGVDPRFFFGFFYRILLYGLQFFSISLAVMDVLLVFYDVLRPTVVDFRIHAAIMMICIVHEARAEEKERTKTTATTTATATTIT